MKKMTLASLAALGCFALSCQQGNKEGEKNPSDSQVENTEQPKQKQGAEAGTPSNVEQNRAPVPGMRR